jgi:hypothetical protein
MAVVMNAFRLLGGRSLLSYPGSQDVKRRALLTCRI